MYGASHTLVAKPPPGEKATVGPASRDRFLGKPTRMSELVGPDAPTSIGLGGTRLRRRLLRWAGERGTCGKIIGMQNGAYLMAMIMSHLGVYARW